MTRTIRPSFYEIGPKLGVLSLLSWESPKMAKIRPGDQKTGRRAAVWLKLVPNTSMEYSGPNLVNLGHVMTISETKRPYSGLQYDHLELIKSKCFLYSNQPTKVDSNTCPDFVYIYHLCFRSNLASYQSFQSPREGGVIKSEKSMLQSNQLNFGTENRKRLLRCLSQLI